MNNVEEMGSQEELHKPQPVLISKHTLISWSFACKLLFTCDFRTKRKGMPVLYRAKWINDEPTAKTTHASSVTASYNWLLMLESGQAQTEADKTTLIISMWLKTEHYPAISIHPEVTAHLKPYLPTSQWVCLCLTEHTAARAIKESHKCSEGPDILMLLCSRLTFVTDPFGSLGSSRSVGSDMGLLSVWVVMHGSTSVLLVVVCRFKSRHCFQTYNSVLNKYIIP